MYELEVRHGLSSQSKTDQAAIHAFEGMKDSKFTHVSLISWSEHCTECAVPACFTTCDLYERRSDGLCRRFANGIVPIKGTKNRLGYIVRIDFKPWGKLMAYGNNNLVPANRAYALESLFFNLDAVASALPPSPWPRRRGRTGLFSPLEYILKKKTTNSRLFTDETVPDAFYLEAFNPASESVNLMLEIRDDGQPQIPFIHKLVLQPSLNKVAIPTAEMAVIPPGSTKLKLQIIPETGPKSLLTLYFGFIGFAKLEARPAPKAESKIKHIKAVIWDLDHTLWNGILTESEPESLALRDGVKDILMELDKRGIVSSITSKNDHDSTWRELERLGVAEYFVFPKINWRPKSENVHEIVANLNIGKDTVAFVDDQPFEREQVRSIHPEIRIYSEDQIAGLLSRPEFNPPLSSESAGRRAFYQTQSARQEFQEQFKDDYFAFLKNCDIRLSIHRGTPAHLDRIHELSQRTNQLNFSGNRYSHEKIVELLNDSSKDLLVLDCVDRFGAYGTIGLAIVDKSVTRSPKMIDLMFSCRVQAKRVEHCLLNFVIDHYASAGAEEMIALWRKTAKNMPGGKVFEALGFEEIDTTDGVTRLRYTNMQHPKKDNIITVNFEGSLRTF